MSFLRVYHEADGEQPLLTTHEPERLRLELDASAIHYRHHPLPAMPERAPSEALLARYTRDHRRGRPDQWLPAGRAARDEPALSRRRQRRHARA
ncbi:hypothetical protein [Salinicola tamaricis]|uniref:hypothetical protein n=1 Tax=Salinicola tamaricis TaxID=1771309 RepID=UPI00101AD5E0|nr:hypothetical protein [Salinicola tamaricis]